MFESKPIRTAPATVPSDTIIPLHFHDDGVIFRSMVVNFTLCFNDPLDPEKLRLSLARLLDRDGWRKLGARLRLNDKGKLEYHIPKLFDQNRPSFTYTQVNYDLNIAEHPLASQLPRVDPLRPSFAAGCDDFRGLMRRPDGPTKIDDYIYTDEPQLSLHIVSFRDATFVSLSWLHTLFDAMGRKALLEAWSLVLQGRDDEVPPLIGVDNDPLATFGTNPTERYKLFDQKLTTWQSIVFGIRYAFRSWWWEDDTRLISIPAAFLQRHREQAMEELAVNTKMGEKPFVSDGDLLCALLGRLTLYDFSPTSEQTVGLMNAFGVRGVLGKDLLANPPGGVFISNAVQGVTALLSVKDVLTKPVSYVAAAVRQSVAELGTREQMEAFVALNREGMDKTGYPPLYGDATMHLIHFSNWSKAKFFEKDFSAAVTRQGESDAMRSNRPGTPAHILAATFSTSFSPRNVFGILGKDSAGNYWAIGTLRKGSWDQVQKKVDEGFLDSGVISA